MSAPRSIARRVADWLRNQNCLTIAVFGVISFLLFIAFSIANQRNCAPGFCFDRQILLKLRLHGDPPRPLGGWRVQDLMSQLTGFGDHAVLTVIVIGAGFYLLLSRRIASAYLVAAVATSGALLIKILKTAFAQPENDFLYHEQYQVYGIWKNSFPSGHTTIATIVYLTLGCLLARERKTEVERRYVIVTAVTMPVIVGITRVSLGVHYPTDVLGGWAIGAAWALLCIAIAHRLCPALNIGARV